MGARKWAVPALAATLLLLGAACTADPGMGGGTGSTTTTTAPPQDVDNDGYNELSDCNDNDASINPDAAETW